MSSQRMQILLEVQDKATRALKKASSGFKKLGRVAAKAGLSIGKAMARIVKSILSLKTVLIAVAGVAGFGLLIKASMSSIDALGKVSKKLGLASDDLQRFRLAAELSGVAQTTLDMGLQRFTRRAAEAAMGTGEAKDALKQLADQDFRSNDAPTGTNVSEGDTWYDLDDNTMKVYREISSGVFAWTNVVVAETNDTLDAGAF